MYNEQLEKLIEFALADGELTEKEKQVLFKKAASFGVDLDEFEMVLDAQLHLKQQSDKAVSSAPKSDKFGDIRKCPSCGAMVESFQTRCLDCGHEFSNIQANSSIINLMKKLDDIESTRRSTGNSFTRQLGIRDKVNNRKKDIIKNFPIPNTKEDILEFLTIAVPNASKKGNFMSRAFESGMSTTKAQENALHNEFAPVWMAKCEQIIIKAKLSMQNDKATLEAIKEYAERLKIKF